MTLHRRSFVNLAVGAGLAATVMPAQAIAAEVGVDPNASKFVPESIAIKAGDSVTWTNSQVVSHSVTFDPAQAKVAGDAVLPEGVAPFDSGEMQQDQTFTRQFTVKGTYKYFCKYHEEMRMVGTVIVS